jgi:cytochrome c biogenesis protein CcmG, thiol:disulfide interchange protein DsbE
MNSGFKKRWERKEIVGAVAVFALLGTLLWTESCSWLEMGGGNKSPKITPAGSEMAVDFTAKNLDAKDVKLSDFKGKVVLVNFWAVWCGPCQEEIPELVQLYNAYRDKGFVIVGVSDPSDLKEIKSFVNEHKMNYPVVIDNGDISDEYNVSGFPTSFLIDRNGKIVKKYPGYSRGLRQNLETLIQKLI